MKNALYHSFQFITLFTKMAYVFCDYIDGASDKFLCFLNRFMC